MGLAGGGQHADRKWRDKESGVQGRQPSAEAERMVSQGHPVNRFGGRGVLVGQAGGQPGLEPRSRGGQVAGGWMALRGCDGQCERRVRASLFRPCPRGLCSLPPGPSVVLPHFPCQAGLSWCLHVLEPDSDILRTGCPSVTAHSRHSQSSLLRGLS